MRIKYGRCTNQNCVLLGKTQDAEDSSFVCSECQAELSDAHAIANQHITSKRPLFIIRMVVDLALFSGVVFFLVGQPIMDVDKTPENLKTSTSQSTVGEHKKLEEWLEKFSVDR